MSLSKLHDDDDYLPPTKPKFTRIELDKLNEEVREISALSEDTKLLQKTAQEFKDFLIKLLKEFYQKQWDTFEGYEESFPFDVEIYTFGSCAANLNTRSSDLDFIVRSDSFTKLNWLIQCAKVSNMSDHRVAYEGLHFIRKLIRDKQEKKYWYVQLLKGKVPVLQYEHNLVRVNEVNKGSKLKLKIDVTFNKMDGVRNTQLLRWYTQLSPRFAILCRAVKNWAHQNKVEDSVHGRLNSFSLSLMLINFLQVASPPVLPVAFDVYPELEDELNKIPQDYHKRNVLEVRGWEMWKSSNTASVGQLYFEFMDYYSRFDWENNYVSVRTGKVLPRGEQEFKTNSKQDKKQLMVVEDPIIEPPFNCAGTVRDQSLYEHIIQKFNAARDLIEEQKSVYMMHRLQRSFNRKPTIENLDTSPVDQY